MLDQVVGYGVLIHYRMALIFWTERKFTARNEEVPPKRILFNGLTQAIRTIAFHNELRIRRKSAPLLATQESSIAFCTISILHMSDHQQAPQRSRPI